MYRLQTIRYTCILLKMTTLKVELVSDIICPWCYIAKTRLERVEAMLKEQGITLEIRVAPFQLYPHIPPGGVPKSDFAKFTKPGMGRSLRSEATEENIKIDYKKIDRIPYSLEAHRLLWLIKDAKTQYRLAKALFHFYFEEGGNVEDHEKLQELAEEAGVESELINQFLTTKDGHQEVVDYIQGLKDQFIMAVPTFILNDRFTVPGIQPVDTMYQYFLRAATR